MRWFRWTAILAAMSLAAALAYFLRDVIQRLVIQPLAYLWWVLGLFYRAMPQYVVWILAVLLAAYLFAGSLVSEGPIRTRRERPRKTPQGPIQELAAWVGKTRKGIYFKWLVANRLGKLARELLAQREGSSFRKVFGPLKGRDWDPPDQVGVYLESGLNGSFADYPHPRWPWSRPQPTPLDLDPREAVEFLEQEMETKRDRHR